MNLDVERGQREACFNVTVIDDNVHEAGEVIGLLLSPGQELGANIRVQPTRTSIVVRDDDSETHNIACMTDLCLTFDDV